MIENYSMEYNDVIQYLNSFVIKKSERLNINFKFKITDSTDYIKCNKSITDIINFVNNMIKRNQYNQYSTNVSSYDGFEKVRRELGLPVSLYPKYEYNDLIELINFSIIHSYIGEFKNVKCFLYKLNVIINRGKDINFYKTYLNFNVDFIVINEKTLIYNIFINGNVKKINNNSDNLYFSNDKNSFSFIPNNLSVNQNLLNEIQTKREKQNEIMQSSIESSINNFL